MKTLAAAVLISVFAAAPAQAQWASITADVIGQTISNMNARSAEEACLNGPTSFSDRAMASAQDGAVRTMAAYITRASASSSADVSRSFSGAHRQQVWIADDETRNVQSVNDPLAQRLVSNGEATVPPPDAFIRSGDGASAEALWILRDPSDANRVAGSYRARFRHEMFRGWMLTRLSISTTAGVPQTPSPFCHEDGDIIPTPKKVTEASSSDDQERNPPSASATTAPP